MISDFISEALRTAAVSVEKNGFPVPEAKITTLFFSKCLVALFLIYGSATLLILIAVITLDSTPNFFRFDCKANEFITVPNIPI